MQRNTRAIFIIREGTALIQGTALDCKNANLRPCRGWARKAVSRIAMVLRLAMPGREGAVIRRYLVLSRRFAESALFCMRMPVPM